MVAPIDANAMFEVEGETISLRLDWRAVAMLEERGGSLFSDDGLNLTLSKCALLVKCLGITAHPEMTMDEALAIVVKHGLMETGAIILDLIARFGGAPAEEDAPKKAKAVKAAA